MQMVELLRRCTRLEQGAARIYDRFARRFRDDESFSRFWTEMAEDERRHANKLATWRRLLRLERKDDYEVPGFESVLRDLEILLGELDKKAAAAETAEDAFVVAIALESSELDPVYCALLQSSPLSRFPDLCDTQRAEFSKHHRRLLAVIRERSKDEKNLLGAALLDAFDE